MAAYRASRHEATGYSPNFLLFGREMRALIDMVMRGPNEEGYAHMEDYVKQIRISQQQAYSLDRDQLPKSAERNKKLFDMRVRPQTFFVGTWVLYYSPRRCVGRSPKGHCIYSEQFLFTKRHSPVTVSIQRSQKSDALVVHTNKLKSFYGETPAAG